MLVVLECDYDYTHDMKQRGFTITELLIVIVIIAVLAAIAVVAYNGIQGRARDARNESQAKTSRDFLERYMVENDSYPTPAEMADSNWRSANGFKDGLMSDAAGNAIVGVGGGDPAVAHISIVIPEVAFTPRCGAIVQVYRESSNTTSTYLLSSCPPGTGFSAPTGGNQCPATFYSSFGNVNFDEDPTTHLCTIASVAAN